MIFVSPIHVQAASPVHGQTIWIWRNCFRLKNLMICISEMTCVKVPLYLSLGRHHMKQTESPEHVSFMQKRDFYLFLLFIIKCVIYTICNSNDNKNNP